MLIINILSDSHSCGQIIDITHTVNMITIECVVGLSGLASIHTDRQVIGGDLCPEASWLSFSCCCKCINILLACGTLYGPSNLFPLKNLWPTQSHSLYKWPCIVHASYIYICNFVSWLSFFRYEAHKITNRLDQKYSFSLVSRRSKLAYGDKARVAIL